MHFIRNVKIFDAGARVKYSELTPQYVYEVIRDGSIPLGIILDERLVGTVTKITEVKPHTIRADLYVGDDLDGDFFIHAYEKVNFRDIEVLNIILEKGELTLVQKIKDAITRFFSRA